MLKELNIAVVAVVSDTFRSVSSELIEITVGEEVVYTTAEHPFFAKGKGWVQAAALTLGLFMFDGHEAVAAVNAVHEVENKIGAVHNFEVAGTNTYFLVLANGERVLVHNACGDGVGKILQSGSNTISSHTAKSLGYTPREIGRALERLKKDLRLPNNHHGKIDEYGNYVDSNTGRIIDNILDYMP